MPPNLHKQYTMREIELMWSYPRNYYDIDRHPDSDCLGIYYISRIWGGKETVIYVGKTLQAFRNRMKQHNDSCDEYTQKRGQLKIRLGLIPQSFNIGNMNKEHFILTLESAIIQNIKDKPGVNLCNRRQINNYTYFYNLAIINTGFHGKIDRRIETCTNE